jgi:uncharacterized protein (DUF433 family)
MEEAKIVSRDLEVMGGELVFAGTRVEVKTLVEYLRAGYTLDDFFKGFPSVSREQAEGYLDMTLEAARHNPRAAGASQR